MRKAQEIVTECLEQKKMSQRQLAYRMGEDVRKINQQLKRQNDMKVGRFSDVLEHAGYRLEVVDNDGIQRVCQQFAVLVIETREPLGCFYTFADGIYVGIDNSAGEARTEKFNSYEELVKWLRHEPAAETDGHMNEA